MLDEALSASGLSLKPGVSSPPGWAAPSGFQDLQPRVGVCPGPFSGSDLRHRAAQSAADSSGKCPQSSSLLFQSQMFRPQFPGLRGPKQGSLDHTAGHCPQPLPPPSKPMARAAFGMSGRSSLLTAETSLLQVWCKTKLRPFPLKFSQRHKRGLRAETSCQTCVLSWASALNAWALSLRF